MIPFNKPFLTGKEIEYIKDAVDTGKISGNGKYTQLCHIFFKNKYDFNKCLLTTSCTDALEMAAILIDVKQEDEIIIPSYTFVSTANAFVLRGAKVVFADSMTNHPNIDADKIEALITPKTKAIVVVHYAGVACDIQKIKEIADKYKLYLIEDAAQAVDNYYIDENNNKIPLGSIGHLSAFSFHETKNIISGEGGMLVINDSQFIKRAEIIWEKGTNRTAFLKGEVDKYGWVDIGSSFLPSEVIAAFLYAQLQSIEVIQNKRKTLWKTHYKKLKKLEDKGKIILPLVPQYSTNNAHMFYIICKNIEERDRLISQLKENDILSVFHYQSLHKSPYYKNKHDGRILENSDMYSERLLRLPMYYELSIDEVDRICNIIITTLS